MKLILGVLLFAASTLVSAQTTPPQSSLSRWIVLPSQPIEIDGLPWYAENHGDLYRLPERLKDTYPKQVWNLAKQPSGGRLRFRTNATTLAIRLEYPAPPQMANLHPFGQSGVDLYVGNTYWGTAIADKDAKPGKVYEHVYFDFSDQPPVEREITLYLPLYLGVKVLGIGVDSNAVISRPAPFALPKPVVFYGTSITQGCCASRPGMSFEAIVGRRLNIDFVNLGFSGSGKYEPALASAVAAIDASCYVLDGSNFSEGEELDKALGPFIRIIRKTHPDTPILVASFPYSSLDITAKGRKAKTDSKRNVTRNVVADFIAQGDHHIQSIEGTDLLSPLQGDGLTDGVHPNDLGFEWFADVYTRRIATVLQLPSQ
jgi:hypothetical protein